MHPLKCRCRSASLTTNRLLWPPGAFNGEIPAHRLDTIVIVAPGIARLSLHSAFADTARASHGGVRWLF